jgi:glycosyltransferase involved in cell wall biosynthesis
LRYLKTPAIYYCHEPPRHLYENISRDEYGGNVVYITLDRLDPFIRLFRSTARKLDKFATRAAKRVLVNSNFIRDQVRKIYNLESTISYHGVDTDIFHPEPQDVDKTFILSVGAIQPHKGFDFLIESIGSIRSEIRPALHLIGNMENPREQQILQALAQQKGVELQIEVKVNEATLVQRYNQAALVAYAPHNEPFGLVPLEAMACGKPVVGINEGGVKETVVHQFTGLLVDRNTDEFGQAIQSLLEKPALMEEYGRNGRIHVLESWSWERAVSELERQMSCVLQGFPA